MVLFSGFHKDIPRKGQLPRFKLFFQFFFVFWKETIRCFSRSVAHAQFPNSNSWPVTQANASDLVGKVSLAYEYKSKKTRACENICWVEENFKICCFLLQCLFVSQLQISEKSFSKRKRVAKYFSSSFLRKAGAFTGLEKRKNLKPQIPQLHFSQFKNKFLFDYSTKDLH